MGKKILFVCTMNLRRSPTAELLFFNSKAYDAKSAGTSEFSYNPLTKRLVRWADIIFCMEEGHRKFISSNFPKESKGKKMVVLNIPDIYQRNDLRLISVFEEKLGEFLE